MLTLVVSLLLLGACTAHQDHDAAADDISADEDMTTTILRMNNGSSELMMEGDIVVPRTRTAMKCFNRAYSCLWTKSSSGAVKIPFIISEIYDQTEKTEILLSMRAVEKKTCIRFVPRVRQRAYLSIEPRSGCSSLMGRVGQRQVLSLQRFGCVQRGIIQHELLHAMGFYHEHTRSDRDQHIRINWANITQYFKFNFKKMNTNNLDTPYDYTSVMHYGRKAFGKNRAVTMTPIPDPSAAIGQRNGLSDMDVLRINRLYRCGDRSG